METTTKNIGTKTTPGYKVYRDGAEVGTVEKSGKHWLAYRVGRVDYNRHIATCRTRQAAIEIL